MIYTEIKGDLFSCGDDYALVQCISADLKMGAGIAVEFNKRFDLKNKVVETWGDKIIHTYIDRAVYEGVTGTAVQYENFINLITKERYWHKPTYKSITEALQDAERLCTQSGIKKLAMPRIGCGLDRLDWSRVRDIILGIFADTDIEIKVFYLGNYLDNE